MTRTRRGASCGVRVCNEGVASWRGPTDPARPLRDANSHEAGSAAKQVNAFNTVWELRLDKPYKNGGSEHSERVGMKGQGNLPNLRTVCAVDGRLNDASVTDVGWGLVARIPFSDLRAAGHCASAPAPLHRWYRVSLGEVRSSIARLVAR